MKRDGTSVRAAQWVIAFAALAAVLADSAQGELVGYWNFEEGGGTAIADSSGLGNDGILVNAKAGTWTSGLTGAALYFDGTTGSGTTYVSVPDALSLHITNAISFSAWVRSDDAGRDAPIVAREGDGTRAYWFGLFPQGHFGVLLDDDGAGTWALQDRDQGSVPAGRWLHVASTWDGSTVRHYVHGVQLAEVASFAGPIFGSSTALILGANVPWNSTAFRGAIDDVRLYNHALSLGEVQALAGYSPGLVGHWSFDEGAGLDIHDDSGRANHGSVVNLQGNTWTAGVSGSALYFDGIIGTNATYVAVPDAASLRIAGDISFAAWVRCDDITRDAPVLAKEGDGRLSYWFGCFGVNTEGAVPGNFGVLLDADGNQYWTLYDRNQGAVPQGEWVHLASVREGSIVRHYLNGEPLSQTAAFEGPINVSDAFLAIGVNSAYNYTAFKGAVDEVSLYNLALGPVEVRGLFLAAKFRITAVTREAGGVRLTWACTPGRSYVVQAASTLAPGAFADVSAAIQIPEDYIGTTISHLHAGAGGNPATLFYRVKLLP